MDSSLLSQQMQYCLATLLVYMALSLNVSTTPLRQWGFRQCLHFSWTTLRGKHCRHPIAVMGVVDTFGLIDPIMSILEHKIDISLNLFSTCVGEGENAF